MSGVPVCSSSRIAGRAGLCRARSPCYGCRVPGFNTLRNAAVPHDSPVTLLAYGEPQPLALDSLGILQDAAIGIRLAGDIIHAGRVDGCLIEDFAKTAGLVQRRRRGQGKLKAGVKLLQSFPLPRFEKGGCLGQHLQHTRPWRHDFQMFPGALGKVDRRQIMHELVAAK